MLRIFRQLSTSSFINFTAKPSLVNIIMFSESSITSNNDFPILKITSINQLVQQRKKYSEQDLFNTNDPSLFAYGIHPYKLRLQINILFKYSHWKLNPFAIQQFQQFIKKLNTQTQECKQLLALGTNKQAQQRYSLTKEYRKFIAIEILPAIVNESWIYRQYVHSLHQYLLHTNTLSKHSIHYILINFDRILFKQVTIRSFTNYQEDIWALINTFNLFLDRYVPLIDSLPNNYKGTAIMIAKYLKVSNLPFLQFLKKDIQKQKKQISLQCFLAAISYLSFNGSFPYQYFYKTKNQLMNYLEAAQNLSQKKIINCIFMLDIFSKERLPYCQNIIDRLLKCIQFNLTASDVSQLSRIFYFYSKLKCSINLDFVTNIIDRLSMFLDQTDEQHYTLIIKAVSNLNYQNDKFVNKLKDYNYELFLSSLKYGCQNLGDYYKAILTEIQTNFKQDSLRSYSMEDEQFKQIPSLSNENPSNNSQNQIILPLAATQ